MRHVFVMDPLAGVKPWKDTTYFLMLAAAERGHEVFVTGQERLSLHHDRLKARVLPVSVHADHRQPFGEGDELKMALADVDVVWERTDPPVNRRYFYASMFLDFLPPSVRVINRPAAIRDWNEKLAALRFPGCTPATLVSASAAEITAFASDYERITLKPVDGHGGKGVTFSGHDDPALARVIAEATADGRRWTIVQEYLPLAREGDKRILLLDGEPLGAVLRLHAEGAELNNLDQGGSANPTELTADDLAICAEVGPALRQAGIVFAGIDVIGGRLIEVNVTSPTGLQEAARFADRPLHHEIMAHLEATRSA